MKTLLKISLVGAVVLATATFGAPKAQAEVYVAGGDPAPVVSPVVYQAPVVYTPVGWHGWWGWHHHDRCRCR